MGPDEMEALQRLGVFRAKPFDHENTVISDDDELVLAFGKTFERLWDSFSS